MKCLLTFSGARIWMSDEEATKLGAIINSPKDFITVKGQLVKKSDISGVYDEVYIKELENVKRGMWQCKAARWHGKTESCNCYQIGVINGKEGYISRTPGYGSKWELTMRPKEIKKKLSLTDNDNKKDKKTLDNTN